MIDLPTLLDSTALADSCREVAVLERLQPWAVEKDYYLTRIIWALAQARGDQLLLKGGTCLSKVDLGFHRMSEDIDLVIPFDGTRTYRSTNVALMKPVREALRTVAPHAGVTLVSANGEDSESAAHIIWEVTYDSLLAPRALTTISVEVGIRPTIRPPRKAQLRQLIPETLAPGYATAFCWSLDAAEARAEKIRAAFTREAIRDFYDLGLFLDFNLDLSSSQFTAVVDAKLREVKLPALRDQPGSFALNPERRRRLDADQKGLAAVVRLDEPPFDLDALIARYNALWGKTD